MVTIIIKTKTDDITPPEDFQLASPPRCGCPKYEMVYEVIAPGSASIKIPLGRSGLSTTIINGASTVGATYFNNTPTSVGTKNDLEAMYIWYGPGTNAACPAIIHARQTFLSKCQSKVILFINADSKFNFTLQLETTVSGSGNDPSKIYEFKWDPTPGLYCGMKSLTQVKSIRLMFTLRIQVQPVVQTTQRNSDSVSNRLTVIAATSLAPITAGKLVDVFRVPPRSLDALLATRQTPTQSPALPVQHATAGPFLPAPAYAV